MSPTHVSRLTAALVLLGALACSGSDQTPSTSTGSPPGTQLRSSKARLTPTAPIDQLQQLGSANAAFGLDVLAEAAGDGNFFASPHSLSLALAMTYAGARGATANQMAGALHFELAQELLHPAFNALDQELGRRSTASLPTGETGDPFTLRIVNALFGQTGYPFEATYLDLLAENYGAGLSLLDFGSDPDGSRKQINAWVSDQTEERIPELIPVGGITSDARLVLTNAIYFKASWRDPFKPEETAPGPFTALDGSSASVPFMHQMKEQLYAEGDGFKAVEIPYIGDKVAMLVILPEPGSLASFRREFDGSKLESIVGQLQTRRVDLALPRFEFRTQLGVKTVLENLGMKDAFEPGTADFSGMDGTRSLFIQDVIHQAFVSVNEKGTEAAAATAVISGTVSIPEPATFVADHPFLFVIRDQPTGAVLFLGQVTRP